MEQHALPAFITELEPFKTMIDYCEKAFYEILNNSYDDVMKNAPKEFKLDTLNIKHIISGIYKEGFERAYYKYLIEILEV